MAERGPGYVFSPTDEQLIKDYLEKKENGLPLPGQVVVELDLYCEKSPWEVLNRNDLPWQIFKTRDRKTRTIYVLTPLKKTSQKAQSRIRRTAGCGKWHECWAKEILNDNDDVIGFKKMLAFLVVDNSVFDGADEGLIKGHWIMHQYTLKSENFPFALCKITRDASKNLKGAPNNARKRKAAVVEEEEVKQRKGKQICAIAEEDEDNQRDGHESNSTFTLPNQFALVEGAEQSTGALQSLLATKPSTSSATDNQFDNLENESNFSQLEDPIYSPDFCVPIDDLWNYLSFFDC